MTIEPGFRPRVEAVVRALGRGEVVSYGDVAVQAGFPGAARAVGRVMAMSDGLPWWRVVMHDGRLAPGKEGTQARRLRAEGVAVEGGRVVGGTRGGAVKPVRRGQVRDPRATTGTGSSR